MKLNKRAGICYIQVMDIEALLDELHHCSDLDEIVEWFNAHAAAIANHCRLTSSYPTRFSAMYLDMRGVAFDDIPGGKFWLWMASDHNNCREFLDVVLPELGFRVLWRAFGSQHLRGSDACVAFKQSDFPVLSVCEKLKA